MLRKYRFSIAGLMGVVLAAALESAALRYSSEAWAGVMLLLTASVLTLAVVGAISRGPDERARWLGFALFGGGYLALVHWMSFSDNTLPTITLAESLSSWLGKPRTPWTRAPDGGWGSLPPSDRIVHCMWALALALLGCILAGASVARPAIRTPAPEDEMGAPRKPSRPWWKRPGVIGLSLFWPVAMTAAAARWPAPGIWAGASFLLTCGLLGLAGLGAIFSQGKAREVRLGAALFGVGYLALTFGKSELLIVAPHLPTEGLLNSVLRPGGPPIASDFPDFTTQRFARVQNRIIRRKLDQPIPMHFRQETPLADVLKHIRESTRDANFPGLPMYVDPVGLLTTGRSMNSTVMIELDAIAAKHALRLCLKQLGLGFSVRDGFLMITGEGSATIPVYEDSVQVVGHSFLALVAAGVGGLAARFVSDRKPRVPGQDHAAA